MSSLRTPGSRPSEQWPEIIDRLLEGSHAEQIAARETLWVEVKHYVHFAQLPIGPLGSALHVYSV